MGGKEFHLFVTIYVACINGNVFVMILIHFCYVLPDGKKMMFKAKRHAFC